MAGDVAWLLQSAPVESAKPWAPVETSLPDPDLLPLVPAPYLLVKPLIKWLFRSPCQALIHIVAWLSSMAAVVAGLLALDGCATGLAMRVGATCAALAALWALERRLVLYRLALVYQVYKSATLGSLTLARLAFRRRRCAVILALLAASVTLAQLPACAARARDPLQLVATMIALPTVTLCITTFSKDLTEEAAIKALSHANCQRRGS